MVTQMKSPFILAIELMGMMDSLPTVSSMAAVMVGPEGQPEDDSCLQPPLVQSIIPVTLSLCAYTCPFS